MMERYNVMEDDEYVRGMVGRYPELYDLWSVVSLSLLYLWRWWRLMLFCVGLDVASRPPEEVDRKEGEDTSGVCACGYGRCA